MARTIEFAARVFIDSVTMDMTVVAEDEGDARRLIRQAVARFFVRTPPATKYVTVEAINIQCCDIRIQDLYEK